MSAIDGQIIGGGTPSATRAQATAYLLGNAARRVSDADVADIIAALWEFGGRVGIDPALALAQICHETAVFAFTGDVSPDQHNPAGIGTTGGGVKGLTFADWRAGCAAYYVHLLTWCARDDLAFLVATAPASLDPRVPIVQQVRAIKGAATTWRSLGGRWAVPGTNYAAGIEKHHNAIVALPDGPGREEGRKMRIALASGHRNTSGGDSFEKAQTAAITPAVARHCRALGMDVRVVQPDDGAGMFAGGLDAVGRRVVEWANAGWVPDIFLEVHTEGGGGVGCFAIYPDWYEDVDVAVANELGPLAANLIALATGLGVRNVSGPGVMSEKRTGVGLQGSRLGIFRTTEPIRATTTRLIIEYGAHDKEPDLSIAKSPDFAEECGLATAQAFAAFLGVEVTPPAPAGEHPMVRAWRELFAA